MDGTLRESKGGLQDGGGVGWWWGGGVVFVEMGQSRRWNGSEELNTLAASCVPRWSPVDSWTHDSWAGETDAFSGLWFPSVSPRHIAGFHFLVFLKLDMAL